MIFFTILYYSSEPLNQSVTCPTKAFSERLQREPLLHVESSSDDVIVTIAVEIATSDFGLGAVFLENPRKLPTSHRHRVERFVVMALQTGLALTAESLMLDRGDDGGDHVVRSTRDREGVLEVSVLFLYGQFHGRTAKEKDARFVR